MDSKSCPNKSCGCTYKTRKKPVQCPVCNAYIGKMYVLCHSYRLKKLIQSSKKLCFFLLIIGGKTQVASPKGNATSKLPTQKVYALDRDCHIFSVHNNKQYRLICQVVPGSDVLSFYTQPSILSLLRRFTTMQLQNLSGREGIE